MKKRKAGAVHAKANMSSKVNRPEIEELGKILELMGRHQVAELRWDTGMGKLHLKTHAAFVAPTHFSAPTYMPAPYSQPQYASPPSPTYSEAPRGTESPAAPKPAAQAANMKQILSPFVGTFYRSSSPGSDAYVKEGQTVKPGDVLCIIEAMKLMNEIESDYSGKVAAILVENGQPVEFGEPLFTIET